MKLPKFDYKGPLLTSKVCDYIVKLLDSGVGIVLHQNSNDWYCQMSFNGFVSTVTKPTVEEAILSTRESLLFLS